MSRKNGTATEIKEKAVETESNVFSNGFDNYEINGITFTGKPRQYRADCQSGQFKIGGAKMLGKTLNLEILAYRKIQDELFGYDFQTWLEIIFIDPQNIISHIMFKSESLDNFDELVLELSDKKVAIACGTVTAQMQPRTSRATGTSYYAVEFTWQPKAHERIEEIKAFAKTIPYEALTVYALPSAA
jgi:hypothetical protein